MDARTRRQRLLALVREGTRSAGWLAQHLGVSARTVHRDVQAIRATGIHISSRLGRRGGFMLADDTPVDVRLDPAQIRELIGALLWISEDDGMLSACDATALFETLLHALPARRERGIRALFRDASPPPPPKGRLPVDQLDALEAAVREAHTAVLVHRPGTYGIPIYGGPLGLRRGRTGWVLAILASRMNLRPVGPKQHSTTMAALRHVRHVPRSRRGIEFFIPRSGGQPHHQQ